MNLMNFDDGTSIDLDTIDGVYEHISRFLRKNGADSDIFASLNRLRDRMFFIDQDKLILDIGRVLINLEHIKNNNISFATKKEVKEKYCKDDIFNRTVSAIINCFEQSTSNQSLNEMQG